METAKAMAAFITSCRGRHLRPKTVETYTWALRYIQDLEQLPTDPYEVELVLGEASAHLGPVSQYDLWRRLRTFFRWVATRYQSPNPFERPSPGGPPTTLIQPPVLPPRLPRLLAEAQVRALLERGCRGHRDWLMVMLVLDTGLRLGEVASLTRASLGDGIGILRVQGKRGTREVRVSQEIMQALLQEGDAQHVWVSSQGKPLSAAGVKLAYRRIFKRAGVKAGPHSIRHTFATRYLARGGDVFGLQRMLGHRDIKSTERYVWLSTQDLEAQHRLASPAREYLDTLPALARHPVTTLSLVEFAN